MSNIIISHDVLNVKNAVIKSGKAYPEIRKYSLNGKITTESVKIFLYENNLLSGKDLADPKCDYSPIAYGLYRAFYTGILSLNETKQTGVINHTPIRLSVRLGGKMADVWAISTLSLVNPLCQLRMKNPKLVCHHCYVKKSLHIGAILNYVQNSFVLMNFELPTEWIPIIRESNREKHPIIRLESFGDLYNDLQAGNYLRIVYANPSFRFGLWTKNPSYLAHAIDDYGKPENLSTVYSMSRVNQMDKNPGKWSLYFDHCFVVVDDESVKNQFLLNPDDYYSCKCGPRSCITCQQCYKKPARLTTAVEMLRK